MAENKIMLLDGHSLLNRAYYGLPVLTNAEGKHTNAVLGFLNIMLRYMEEEHLTCGRCFSELPTLNDVFLEITGKELRD